MELEGGLGLRPSQPHKNACGLNTVRERWMTRLMHVGMVWTVIGNHDRRLARPSGILRRDMGTAPCIGCGTYAFVFFLVHAAGTNEWLAVPHKMPTTRRFKQL